MGRGGSTTVGAGGHTRLLAERISPGGEVIALDLDPGMIARAKPGLADLPVVSVDGGAQGPANPLPSQPDTHPPRSQEMELFAKIEGLAELHRKGIRRSPL